MYKVILDYHKDVYFTINEMSQKMTKTLGWNVYIKDEEFEVRSLYMWTEDNWRHTYKNEISFFIPWERVVELNSKNPKFYILYIDLYTREEVEDTTKYSITMSTEDNIPERLESETTLSYMLKPSQLDFFYIGTTDEEVAMVTTKYGKIELFYRYVSTSTEGEDPQKWSRPIIPQYTTGTIPEMPDEAPTILHIDKNAIKQCRKDCYLLLGLLCSEDEIECVYDVTNTKDEKNPPASANIPQYQEGVGKTNPEPEVTSNDQEEQTSTEPSMDNTQKPSISNSSLDVAGPKPTAEEESGDWFTDNMTMIMIVGSTCGIAVMILIAWCCCLKKKPILTAFGGDVDDSQEMQPRFNAEGL